MAVAQSLNEIFMMTKRAFFILAVVVMALTLSCLAYGDTVTLVNGDHFTGQLLKLKDDNLQFKTEYADVIKVKWKYVRLLETDEPVMVKFDNGETTSVLSVEVKDQVVVYKDTENNQLKNLDAQEIEEISPEAWEENEKGFWKGKINLSVKSDRGNVDADFIDFDAEIAYERRLDRWQLSGEWEHDRKEDQDQGSTNVEKDKWLLKSSYNYFFFKSVYSGLSLMIEHDNVGDLHYRFVAGPLLGHEIYKSKKINLLGEIGLFWVDENYHDAPDEDKFIPGWHIKFDKYVYKNILQFYHEHIGVASLNSNENWFFKSWTGFRVPLGEGIQASVEHKLEYDNDSPDDKDTTETTIRLKIGYEW